MTHDECPSKYTALWAQKAKKLDLTKNLNLDGWWVTPKLDGVGSITTFNDTVQMFSISKAKVSGEFTEFTDKVPHLIEQMNNLNFNGTLQGEIIATHLPTCDENFGFVTGTLHAFDAIERQEKANYLSYIIYDMPSHTGTYKERYSALKEVFKDAGGLQHVKLIDILGISKNDSWIPIFNNIVDAGGEGCVLYNPENKYKHSEKSNQRNSGVLKCKASNEKEILCIEKMEGQGKYAESLGALKAIDGEGRDFHIGSFNITDDVRKYIWNNVEPPFIAEMLYYQMTSTSYKLPRFSRLRLDKDVNTWNPE